MTPNKTSNNLMMANTMDNYPPAFGEQELSELDEATVALVMADQVLRERVIYLSMNDIQGAQLRKEIIELMGDISRLKKMDREFHFYVQDNEYLKTLFHPLQCQRENVDHIFELMNQSKQEIQDQVNSMKDKSDSKRVELEIDRMLQSFIANTRFYLEQAPQRH